LSLLVEGSIDPVQKLAGYYEMDFLGTGAASNYNQSNSWDLRLRQAHLTYDNSATGFHLMAGRGWSMATPDRNKTLNELAALARFANESEVAVTRRQNDGFLSRCADWARCPGALPPMRMTALWV